MKTNFWILGAMVFLFSSCASIDVSNDYDPAAPFSSLKTYDWEKEIPKTGNPKLDSSLLHSRIQEAVNDELAARGYVRNSSNPDFKVVYYVGLEDKIDVSQITTYDYGYPTAYGFHAFHGVGMPRTETMVYQYEQGTLVLDFVNPQTKKLMWRGTGSAVAEPKLSPEKREAKIRAGVKKILNQFPPKIKK